jgi:hypothetical protein
MPGMVLLENKTFKVVRSKEYNFIFRKTDGYFERWGATKAEDPQFSPYGPEILDLEISEGECLGNCPFCYKCNGSGVKTVNMTLDTFKTIFHKMPRVLTQIAFGITNILGNPDFFPMMEYARENGVIPNYTCHGLEVDEEIAKQTAAVCGAVAVSIVRKEKTYDAINLFSAAGMKQCNIHYMLSEETYERAFEIAVDAHTDPRLKGKLNAIVFLQYKPKGKNPGNFHAIQTPKQYKELIEFCQAKEVGIGFDSCSAPLYFKSVADHPKKDKLLQFAEPCEAFGMFSSYINAHGQYFPCSFCEGESGWEDGLDVLNCTDFIKDVWEHPRLLEWRKIIQNSSSQCQCEFVKICRSCPVFDVTACKKVQIT